MAKKLKKTECLSGNQEHLGNIPEYCDFFFKCVKPFALGRAGLSISLTILAALDGDKTGGLGLDWWDTGEEWKLCQG